ncbi:hypothetical protein BKA69DRAFT_649257 [Paraphysoderma sedebokerense]|nr:hypothetical protein BKA69DRAFT_649257 [Paraphysoderma sedebokerense]
MSRGSEAGSNYGYSVSQVVESLKSIKSHSEFYRALQVLRLGCISVDDYFEFGVTAAEESIKRFLLVPPATEQDATLLIQFLSFLSKILRRRICSHRFMKMLHDAVASNIANFIAWNIDAEIGDIRVTLNNEILRFLR